ncbi:MAG: GNAT family N-acetyltransferase [Burkholderiales bacterium]|nr:GNAT family N-acetyltransferase [Burkholderiales bacterium]
MPSGDDGGLLAEVIERTAALPAESFFLSAPWLLTCLKNWQGEAQFRTLKLDEQQPAYALVGQGKQVRHRWLSVNVLALNQSTIRHLDQPWIERNGFFCSPASRFGPNLTHLLDLLEPQQDWDELRLSGLMSEDAELALTLAAQRGLAHRIEFDEPIYWVDLDRIRSHYGGDYLASRSTNTRQQLRRARRMAERELGPLRLEQASSTEQALEWFEITGPAHRSRWGDDAGPDNTSGFDNPAFVAFHRDLIAEGMRESGIQYLRLKAGETTLAYLYNFVSNGHACFYLSGIDYSVDSKFKPGMLAHWMAIEHNLALGHHIYDFLAGGARYKRSLSTDQGRMLWVVLQRQRWKFALENLARRLKRSLMHQP